MKRAPFKRTYFNESVGKIEFRHFKSNLSGHSIKQKFLEIEGAKLLDDVYSFWIDDDRPDQRQVNLGNRSMFRKLSATAVAVETGPSLLYTLGPTGLVAVAIYPAKSKLARVEEDHIYLRVGRYSGWELEKRIVKDLNYLVDYAYVTSLDGDPSFWRLMKIRWLRRFHPVQMKRMYVDASLAMHSGLLLKFTLKTLVAAVVGSIFRPLAVIVVVLALIHYGRQDLVSYLGGK